MGKMKPFCNCKICLGYIARCMVEPIRGFPTAEDYERRDERQKKERELYLKEHKQALESHGFWFDYPIKIIKGEK